MTWSHPDLTLLGWTPTEGQWATGTAIAIGVVAGLGILLAWKRARRLALAIALTAVVSWYLLQGRH